MEEGIAVSTGGVRSGPSAISITPARIGAIAAIVGGILVSFEPTRWLGYIGIFLAIVGTVLMLASARVTRPGLWRLVLLVGVLLAAFSPLVATSDEALGGWMGAVGALALVCAAITGFPVRRRVS